MKVCPECKTTFRPNRKEQVFCGRRCANLDRSRKREAAKEHLKRHTVWSCGGGVESVALAVLIIQGRIPKPDYAVMIACGYDAGHTLAYATDVLIPNLAAVGVTLNIVKSGPHDLISPNGILAIPAYTQRDGKIIKYNTYCNNRFKVQPAMAWIRAQGVKRCENWVGVSAGEAVRARPSTKAWITYRYPLVELGIDRDECAWIIGNHGWPKVEHSSCIMCPQQTEWEWQKMKHCHPDDYERARQIEADIRRVMPGVYLRRSLRPL